METHWDRTWRRFGEAIEQKRRRGMNETRRDALVEKVTGILDARSQLTATELSHRDIYQDANELIEAVTRHRDAEIREALLSDEVVEAARDAIEAEVYAASHPGGRYSEEGLARAALQAALAAAKGTEGRE